MDSVYVEKKFKNSEIEDLNFLENKKKKSKYKK